jgi:hypothetical protein
VRFVREVAGDRSVFALLVESEGRRRGDLLDSRLVHLAARVLAGFGTHGDGEVREHASAPAQAQSVEGGFLHAVGFRQAHHVDGLDPGGAQDLLEGSPLRVLSLEAGVGRRVLSLLHRGVQGERGDRLVQFGLGRSRHPVLGPGVHEVGRVREVGAGVDVPVLGGDEELVLVRVLRDEIGDPLGNGIAAFDAQGTAFAEGGLNVDDDQGTCVFFHGIPPAWRVECG